MTSTSARSYRISPAVTCALLQTVWSRCHSRRNEGLAFFSSTHVSFKTINKLKFFFECGISMRQDAGAPLLLLLQMFNLYIISIAVFEKVPPTQGFRKEPPFQH
jgi:hypothetical protein